MSRLRNRNIRTKIEGLTQWSDCRMLQNGGSAYESSGKTATADSGVVSESLSTKFGQLGHTGVVKPRRGNWEEQEGLQVLDLNRRHGNPRSRSDEDADADVSSECSSVDTLKVLDEIRNLEDSVKSLSAESYNSWNAEYEHDNTRLVKMEFERMERVLQCIEPIPGNYDKDEYRLWIKTFPILGLVSRSSSDSANDRPSTKICDNPSAPSAHTPTPSRQWSAITAPLGGAPLGQAADTAPAASTTSTTTTYSSKLLAVNSTINPRTTHIGANDSFLQLAPLNVAGRRQAFKPTASGQRQLALPPAASKYTSDWPKELRRENAARGVKHARRKSSKAEPFKSSSDFIVLPPIEGKQLRSSSAAAIKGGATKMAAAVPLVRLKHPPVHPLYENDPESDHNDGFVSFRHRKRKYK